MFLSVFLIISNSKLLNAQVCIDSLGSDLKQEYNTKALEFFEKNRTWVSNNYGYMFFFEFKIGEDGEVKKINLIEYPNLKIVNDSTYFNFGKMNIENDSIYCQIKQFVSLFLNRSQKYEAENNVNYVLPIMVDQGDGFAYSKNNFFEIMNIFFTDQVGLYHFLPCVYLNSYVIRTL